MAIAAGAGSSSVDFLQSVDTPTLSNAIELLKLRPDTQGFTPLGVRCVSRNLEEWWGALLPPTLRPCPKVKWTGVNLLTSMRQSHSHPSRQLSYFRKSDPFPDYAAHCGEVMAIVFTRLGAIGLVSDCAVRDVPEVRAMKFRYFARGMVASHGCFRIVRVAFRFKSMG